MPSSTEVVRPVCTTVLVMPQADESLDSRRHVIYFRSQLLWSSNWALSLAGSALAKLSPMALVSPSATARELTR